VVTHRIAGITFRTESNAWLPRLQEEPYERFRVGDDVEPDVRHRIHKVTPDSLTLAPPTGEEWERLSRCTRCDPGGLESPLLYSPMVRTRLCMGLERVEEIGVWLYPDRVIVHDFSQCVFDFFYTEEYGEYDDFNRRVHTPEERVAANFRQMFSAFLPRFSAILIHSSGVIRDGMATLFLAPDEGGKTTVLSHLTEGDILNDDQIILRQEGDVVIAHGTPLGSMTSGPCQARVGALFVIEKAPYFELMPIEPADLVQFIWTERRDHCTFFLPKHLKRRAFEVLCDVCYQAPAYWMSFPKDYVDWEAIDAAMV
jgi:hypothetical protein